MAKKVYGKEDPTQIFFTQRPIIIEKTDGGFDLSLNLPFVQKKDLDLFQKGEELHIRVGGYKRNILLPHSLLSCSLKEAKFEEERLRISFRQ
jgi:arsenite-transporting ATPase